MITVEIDELTPCLKNVMTGDIVDTEVIRLKRKSFLSKFNKKTGWYVNWGKFSDSVEVYALVIKGTVDIQGMIALENQNDVGAVHILWACASPENNKWENGMKKYEGVGGHLFAIAGNKSFEYGHDGFVYGEAMDNEILEHYISKYNAEKFEFGFPTHPYRLVIGEEAMKKIMEVYCFDYSDEEI